MAAQIALRRQQQQEEEAEAEKEAQAKAVEEAAKKLIKNGGLAVNKSDSESWSVGTLQESSDEEHFNHCSNDIEYDPDDDEEDHDDDDIDFRHSGI